MKRHEYTTQIPKSCTTCCGKRGRASTRTEAYEPATNGAEVRWQKLKLSRPGGRGHLALIIVPLSLFLLGAVLQPAPSAHAEAVTGTIAVGNNPEGVAYDSGAGEMFVANSGAGRTVSVISDGTNAVVATITLASGTTSLLSVAYDSAKGEIFVASQGAGTVSVICDGTVASSLCTGPSTTNAVVATIGPSVSGLSCDSGSFPTCTGFYTANAVAYDSAMGEILVTNGSCLNSGGSTPNVCYVYVISDSSNTVVAAIPIGSQPGYANGMAYDPGKGEIFVPVNSGSLIKVVSDSSNAVVATVSLPGGSAPYSVAYDSAKGEIFVANQVGTVSVISDSTNAVVATVTFGSTLNPGIAYDSRTGEIFVSVLSYYVSVISDSTNTVTGSLYVGLGPDGIAYDSGKGETFAAVSNSNSVIVISDPTLTLTPTSVSSGGSTTLSGSNYQSSSLIDSSSCTISSGYIYCVGGNTGTGYTSAVYYAQVSSGGVGSWASTTAYPTSVFGASCVIFSGYIYCVGGYTGSALAPSTTNVVYYAPISSSGVGSWATTSAYPTSIMLESCALSSSYIYCVGGYTGSSYVSAVYYAQLSSSGIPSTGAGSWTSTTAYYTGLYGASCGIDSSSGYIFCVGGYTGSSYVSAVYYALASSGGVGSWTSTTTYPTGVYVGSCAMSSGYMYCTGGYTGSAYTSASYYAPVSGTGAGAWTSTAAYPATVDRESCAISSGYVYCVGGNNNGIFTSAVDYAPVSSSGFGSWTSTGPYGARTYNYCFESGVTSSPTACPSTYQFARDSSSNIPTSTTLTVSGSTGLVVVSDTATGAVVSSALVTVSADPTVSVAPTGPLAYHLGQAASTLTATVTHSGPDTATVEWFSSSTSSCSHSSTDTLTAGTTLTPSTSFDGATYFCAVVSDSGVSGYTSASNAVEVTVSVAIHAITLTPTHGPVGTSVSVSGTGFSASTGIGTFTYGGITPMTQTCTSQTTSSTGTFSCTFTVPSSSGAQPVIAWGSDHGSVPADNASATFTASTLTIAPSAGAAGTSTMLSGSGYANSHTYNYCYEPSTTIAIACSSAHQFTTDSSGNLPGSVAVTTSGTSKGLVVVSDPSTSAVVASAIFTVATGAVQASTVTSVACNPSTVIEGGPTLCTATVTGSPATGTVTFSAGSGSFSPNAACVLTTLTTPSSCFTIFVAPPSAGAVTISASYSGDSNDQASSENTSSVVVAAGAPTAFNLACASSSIAVGATTSCTINVAPTSLQGNVGFSTSNSNGILSIGSCTLSTGNCTISLIGASAGTLTVTATLAASSSITPTITITTPTSSAVTGSAETSVGAGGSTSTAAIGGTGITVAVTNTGAAVGTSVGAVGQVLTAPTQASAPSLTSPVYIDVQVGGVTTGTATVCVTDTSANSQTTMQFWTGTAWASASGVTVTGTSVCGQIPVADLTGTNVVVGQPPISGGGFVPPTSTSFYCPSSSAAVGTYAMCTVTVTSSYGAPSGTVSFFSYPSSASLGLQTSCSLAASSSTSASCIMSVGPRPGSAYYSYIVTASYSGDQSHGASRGSVSLAVQDPTSTKIVCSPPVVAVGASTMCTMTVEDATSPSSIPTAFVLLSGPSSLGSNVDSGCNLDASGECSIVLTPTSAGPSVIVGQYVGDATHAGSEASASIMGTAVVTATTSTSTSTISAASSTTSITTSPPTTTSTSASSTTSASSSLSSISTTTVTTSTSTPTVTQTLTVSSNQSASTSTVTQTGATGPTTSSSQASSGGFGSSFYLLAGVLAAVVVVALGIMVWRRKVASDYARLATASR